jgi:hypothetical protein
MFPRSTPSPLARRARNALSLARSFLLLEDDYDVDWEVDRNEPRQGVAPAAHPHRAPLRGRTARERAGQTTPGPQVCVSPLPTPERSHGDRSRTTTGRPRAARL